MHLHTGLPSRLTSHRVLGPHGLGKQGSGGGVLASILPHPVMVSGWGANPGRQVHTGLPNRLTLQLVLGPQGEGSHGSGLGTHLKFWQMFPDPQSGSLSHSLPHPVMVSGLGT